MTYNQIFMWFKAVYRIRNINLLFLTTLFEWLVLITIRFFFYNDEKFFREWIIKSFNIVEIRLTSRKKEIVF